MGDIISGKSPTGKVVATFKPKTTFTAEELGGSVYVEGMVYKLREGNEKLRRALNYWLRDGKVEVAGDISGGE